MIRIVAIIFFLTAYNFCSAQTNNSNQKGANKKEKTSVQQDTAQQKITVYISYEIGEDSIPTNIKYKPMSNLPAPTDKMIAEAIRIVSTLRTPPQKDESGQNRKLVTRIVFTPDKED